MQAADLPQAILNAKPITPRKIHFNMSGNAARNWLCAIRIRRQLAIFE